jgi:chloramphenicol O-acetyltransferase type A
MRLTYSATVHVDISAFRRAARRNGSSEYLAQIWMLTTAANQSPEFRMSLDGAGRLGIWEQLSPLFTVLNRETRTFSGLWTPYRPRFQEFAQQATQVIETCADGSFEPQDDIPANVINISSIPWVDFTAFNLNLQTDYMLPILTIGRYSQVEELTLMPLAIQVHHAVCDGYHLGQFVEAVRTLAAEAEAWLTP